MCATRTVRVPEDIADRFVGLTAEGYFVIRDTLMVHNFPLTPCCHAAVTYSDHWLCCKACWAEMPLELDVIDPPIAVLAAELDIEIVPVTA